MKKIWIDTDIGGDVDDAFAISMALHSRDIQVMGISLLYPPCQWRMDITLEMLKAYGREDIPVYFGAERPLVGAWGEVAEPKANAAVEAILHALRQDADLILLAIAPLTNIALACLLAPELFKGRKILLMGGVVKRAQGEWNIQCDPEAARIVLESGADTTMLGLDVTEHCRITHEQAVQMLAGDTGELRFLQKEYASHRELMGFDPVLHDPLALATLLWDDLVDFGNLDIRVELEGGTHRGSTVVCPRGEQGAAKVRYGVTVEAKKALERICERIRNWEQGYRI